MVVSEDPWCSPLNFLRETSSRLPSHQTYLETGGRFPFNLGVSSCDPTRTPSYEGLEDG